MSLAVPGNADNKTDPDPAASSLADVNSLDPTVVDNELVSLRLNDVRDERVVAVDWKEASIADNDSCAFCSALLVMETLVSSMRILFTVTAW